MIMSVESFLEASVLWILSGELTILHVAYEGNLELNLTSFMIP
jgi:hypothetical protein